MDTETYILAALMVGGAYVLTARKSGSGTLRTTYDDPRPSSRGAPFAAGDGAPVFPIHRSSKNKRRLDVSYVDVNGKVHNNPGRVFRASRNSRNHAGIDIFANAGDAVLAPEAGRLLSTQNFLDTIPGKDAVLLQGDRGVTFLLGEIVAKSFKQFGLELGDRVKKGQPVARVGLTANGSHMLHFETYRCCPTKNTKWYKGGSAPGNLLDPTDYLLRARQAG